MDLLKDLTLGNLNRCNPGRGSSEDAQIFDSHACSGKQKHVFILRFIAVLIVFAMSR